MTSVERIYDYGEWHTVLLACGHRRKVRREVIAKEQLYLGKRVDCTDCLYEELSKEPNPVRKVGEALEALYPWGYRSEENEP